MKKSLPTAAQLAGVACVVVAVAVLASWAWGLLLAGVLLIVGATLREGGWI